MHTAVSDRLACTVCIARQRDVQIVPLLPSCVLWRLSHLQGSLRTPMQSFPQEGPTLLAPALQALLADVLSGREPAMVVAPALGVFARVVLHNSAAFLQLCAAAAPHIPLPPPDATDPTAAATAALDPPQRLLLALLDLWLDKFDSIGQAPARKLGALALCALLAAPLPAVLDRMDVIVAHMTGVWYAVESPEGGGVPGGHSLDFYAAAAAPRDDDIHASVNSEEAEGEAARRLALLERDPVPALQLSTFSKQQLEAAAAVHGPAVNAALNALDPALGQQLKTMLDAAAA